MTKTIQIEVPNGLPVTLEFLPSAETPAPRFRVVSWFPLRVRVLQVTPALSSLDPAVVERQIQAGLEMDVLGYQAGYWLVFDNTDTTRYPRAARRFQLWVAAGQDLL